MFVVYAACHRQQLMDACTIIYILSVSKNAPTSKWYSSKL